MVNFGLFSARPAKNEKEMGMASGNAEKPFSPEPFPVHSTLLNKGYANAIVGWKRELAKFLGFSFDWQENTCWTKLIRRLTRAVHNLEPSQARPEGILTGSVEANTKTTSVYGANLLMERDLKTDFLVHGWWMGGMLQVRDSRCLDVLQNNYNLKKIWP